VGRGAFATAFAAYKTGAERVTYTHLENDWLQPLLDFGAPVGLLTVAALAWLWLRAARRRDLDWPEVGLLAGAGALAAQGLVDFSLERPAAALAFSVMLGLLQRGEGGLTVRPSWRLGAAGALGLAAAGGMALWLAHPTDGDAARVAAAPDAATAEARARELDRWHPADWLPPAVVGGRWVEAGRCAPAMPWLLEAMRRNPTAPEPHLHAARCLAAAAQVAASRREYRLAYLFGRGDALEEAARRWPTAAALREVAPASGEGLIAGAMALRRLRRPVESAELLRLALEEFGETRALAPLAGAALEGGDAERALALARRLEALAPLDAEGWRLASAALVALGQREASDTELVLGLARLPGAPALVATQVERALQGGRPAEALRLAEGMAARTPGELATRQAWSASALAALGRLPEAIERLRSAAAALPDDAWPEERLAALCAQAGRLDDAVAALEHAASRPGQDPSAWTARLEALRRARDEAAARRRTEALLQGQ
jgi:tetratricopeptide (TPR) repeat protein